VVWVGSTVPLRRRFLLTETILGFLQRGMVLLMNTTEAEQERGYFRSRALKAFEKGYRDGWAVRPRP